MNSASWVDLPEYCLGLVLGKLPAADVANARLVCSHWARIALGARTQVHIRRELAGVHFTAPLMRVLFAMMR